MCIAIGSALLSLGTMAVTSAIEAAPVVAGWGMTALEAVGLATPAAATASAPAAMSGVTAGFTPGITGASIASAAGVTGSAATTAPAGFLGLSGSTWATMGLEAAGLAGAAGGGIQAIQASQEAGVMSAMEENNANLADAQVKQTALKGLQDRETLRRQSLVARGDALSSLGGSGVAMESGNIGTWLTDFDRGVQRDLANLDTNTRSTQWGYQNEAKMRRAQAKLYRRNAPWGVGTGLLNGVSALGNAGAGMYKL